MVATKVAVHTAAICGPLVIASYAVGWPGAVTGALGLTIPISWAMRTVYKDRHKANCKKGKDRY